ncbi:8726_t:CDS:2, partial [Gigaspora margarita]
SAESSNACSAESLTPLYAPKVFLSIVSFNKQITIFMIKAALLDGKNNNDNIYTLGDIGDYCAKE